MKRELYENTYLSADRFSFGKNWEKFLGSITDARIERAKTSLARFLGDNHALQGKTFIDVGCGSGLSSLAALQLKADRVVSIDVDQYSLACTRQLYHRANQPDNWTIHHGSALDGKLGQTHGQFDVVYSWGVLHHTGDMYRALENILQLVKPGGILYIALYNNSASLLEGTSLFWKRIKRLYNASPWIMRQGIYVLYTAYLLGGLAVTGRNPRRYIQEYSRTRGMSWFRDIEDWLGGYPYEYASAPAIINFCEKFGFACEQVAPARSIGCSEYLFRRVPATLASTSSVSEPQPHGKQSASTRVSIVLSVYNGAQTLNRCLTSLTLQTYQDFRIICVDDCSTDATTHLLKKWMGRLGQQRLTIITNAKNIGLTESLNLGIAVSDTEFIARIDADDWWHPRKLAQQVAFLDSSPRYGIVGTAYINVGSHHSRIIRPPQTDASIRRTILQRNPFAHSAVLFRHALIQQVGGYDSQIRYGQDYELWLRLLSRTRFYNLSEVLCYRMSDHGISRERQREQMRQALHTKRQYIKQNHLPLVSYLVLIEPYLLTIMPERIKRWKRKMPV